MSGMADVLAAHKYDRERAVCSCSDFVQVGLKCDPQTHEQHVAAALSAAGFGPVQEARAEGVREASEDILAGLVNFAPEELLAVGFVEGYRDACLDAAIRGDDARL